MRVKNFIRISWSTTAKMKNRLVAAKAAYETLTGNPLKFSQFLGVVVEAGLKQLARDMMEEGDETDGGT